MANGVNLDGVSLDVPVKVKLKVYPQATEPTLDADDYIAIWVDTDAADQTWMVFRRGAGDQVKVEMS